MDVLSCIDKAYKAMKLIKKTIDDVKDAPDSLQLLRLRASYIEALLNELDRLPARFLSEAEDRADLQRFAAIAAKSVEEVEDFLAKVLRSGKNGDRKVNKARFLQSKAFGSNIEDLSTKLDSLQKTLTLMCDIVTLRSKSQATTAPSQSEVLLEEVATALRRVDITMSALSVRTSIPAPRLITPTSHNRLRCLVGCECRCHSPGTSQVVTSWLTPYVGKVNVPKQRPCDVQTCRQDRTMPSHAVWYLPLWMAKVEAQISSPFYLSIRTPRMVRGDAQIWHSIWEADIAGVRGLLLSGEASVLDVNEQGWTVLRVCSINCDVYQSTATH
ncbi:hypothetical protein BC835DRAFT_1362381 [Cytidiella melzeri]|nr:hypothetical protein BC835DRAFT_1362381 [Cytidiella melzeri]